MLTVTYNQYDKKSEWPIRSLPHGSKQSTQNYRVQAVQCYETGVCFQTIRNMQVAEENKAAHVKYNLSNYLQFDANSVCRLELPSRQTKTKQIQWQVGNLDVMSDTATVGLNDTQYQNKTRVVYMNK